MKVLVFVMITMTIGFTSGGFAQTYCGLVETDADTPGTHTWRTLESHLVDGGPPVDHWKDRKAKYYINTVSQSAPAGAASAIKAAAKAWNDSAWKGQDKNDFKFEYAGSTGTVANKKDGKNVISFQALSPPDDKFIARTFYL